jgi:hypothetical protein
MQYNTSLKLNLVNMTFSRGLNFYKLTILSNQGPLYQLLQTYHSAQSGPSLSTSTNLPFCPIRALSINFYKLTILSNQGPLYQLLQTYHSAQSGPSLSTSTNLPFCPIRALSIRATDQAIGSGAREGP